MLILNIIDERSGLKSRLLKAVRFTRVERHIFPEGRVIIINQYADMGRIGWRTVERMVHKHRVKMVMSRGAEPPYGCSVEKFDSSEFRQKILIDTFIKIIRRARPKAVGIYGEIPFTAAAQLLSVTGQLRICTETPEKYRELTERAVSEYGTAPVISDSLSVLSGTAAILAVEGGDIEPVQPGTPVFSNDYGYSVGDASFILPAEIEEILPESISKTDFLAAAVERGMTAQCPIECRYLCKNGGRSAVNSLCKLVAGR